uniref:Uncharacterized protein n=1 Tax=uncultured marine virus TaxID=186617 RepID=A0A0F7L6R0_9VIRU|nr:hypothetical protein [uncultured marine virus]
MMMCAVSGVLTTSRSQMAKTLTRTPQPISSKPSTRRSRSTTWSWFLPAASVTPFPSR